MLLNVLVQEGSDKWVTGVLMSMNVLNSKVFVPDLEIAKTPMVVSSVFAHGDTNLTNLEHFARTGMNVRMIQENVKPRNVEIRRDHTSVDAQMDLFCTMFTKNV